MTPRIGSQGGSSMRFVAWVLPATLFVACPNTAIGPIPCRTDDNCPASWSCSAQGVCAQQAGDGGNSPADSGTPLPGDAGLNCGASATCNSDGGVTYCANLTTDNANCGVCGENCPSGQVCSDGSCEVTCGSLTTCTPDGGVPYCANLSSDNANCGACGNVCSAVTLCTGGQCQGISLLNGLQAYWKLEADGTDSSGNGNFLQSGNSNAPIYAPGKIGNAMSPGIGTDYTCPNCGFLQAPDNPYLNFVGASSSDFTVSLWAKHAANANVDGTWYSYALFDNGQVGLSAASIGIAPNPAYPQVALGAGGTLVAKLASTQIDFRANPDVWVHLIAYARGNTLGLRVNGVETTTMFGGKVGTAEAFYLGISHAGYNWQGQIDEVGKWNRALTGPEMDALYNNGAGLTYPF
jgi:hypothetical protein